MTELLATAAPESSRADESVATERRTFRIGDLAREFDVTLRTLRFYEDKGLVTPERRGTTRIYSEGDRDRLQLALFCKRIGLPLKEIRTVLQKHEQPGTEDEIDAILRRQRDALVAERGKIDATLEEIDTRLGG